MDESFSKQEKKRAFGRAWELLSYWLLTGQNFPRQIEGNFEFFAVFKNVYVFYPCFLSRNRERFFAEPRLENTALDGGERSTAGSSRANHQYVYTTEKNFLALSYLQLSVCKIM